MQAADRLILALDMPGADSSDIMDSNCSKCLSQSWLPAELSGSHSRSFR